MVNFRFHLVSLTAVFLALAAGIAIGAGVVDRQTVALLESRLQTVEQNREQTNRDNDALRADLDRWARFSDEVGERLVEGRLTDVPVLLVSVEGTDRGVVDRLRRSMQAAGASVQGALWLTDRWALDDDSDVERIAAIANMSETAQHDELRRGTVTQLVSTWSAGALADTLLPLRDAGFVTYDPPPGRELPLEQVALPSVEVVVVSGSGAAVPNDELALGLVDTLLGAGIEPLVAEPVTSPETEGERAPAPGIAAVVRDEDTLVGRVSSVDNVDDYRGRVAAVFALAELRLGRTGHYGVADGAQRLLPEPPR